MMMMNCSCGMVDRRKAFILFPTGTIVNDLTIEMISTFQRNRHFRKASANKTFTHVQEQNKGMLARHSAYIPSSVKSP